MTGRILVTGAAGFVGSELCRDLVDRGYRVRRALRSTVGTGSTDAVVVGEIGPKTCWTDALRDVEAVVHLAARVHMRDAERHEHLYTETNVLGTERLLEAAAAANVSRFIYVSSIKVNGEGGRHGPYGPDDPPSPCDMYGQSKWAAEQKVVEIAARGGMEYVIVRPPLVYGPGVHANFRRLLDWVYRERPLPLGAVRNTRSLVSVWNLCDLLLHVLTETAACGRVWMVSDNHDLSTPELIRRLGDAMGRRVRLWPVPVSLLRGGASLLGMQDQVARLCESLTVDVRQTIEQLRWSPPLTLEQGLERTVRWYLDSEQRRAA